MGVTLGDATFWLRGNSKDFDAAMTKAETTAKQVGDKIGAGLARATQIGAVALGAVGTAAIALGKSAMPLETISAAFDGIAASAGHSGDEMLASMQKASNGMVSARDLMTQYNLAASLVSTTFADQLGPAMALVGKVSASTGQDMSYLMESLIRGVGRLSPMILDNLAIQVDLSAANEAYAKSVGKSADELTKQEQQTALMNQVMEKLRQNTASMPEVAGTASQKWAEMTANLQNLKDTVGLAVLPGLTALVEKVNQGIGAVQRFANENQALIGKTASVAMVLGPVLGALTGAGAAANILTRALGPLAGMFGGLGGSVGGLLNPLSSVAGWLMKLPLLLSALGAPVGVVVGAVGLLAAAIAVLVGGIKKFLDRKAAATQFMYEMQDGFISIQKPVLDLGAIIKKVWDGIQLAVKVAVVVVQDLLKGLAWAFDQATTWVADRLFELEPVLSQVADAFAGVFDWLIGIANQWVNGFVAILSSLMTYFQDIFQLIYDIVTGNFEAVGKDALAILGSFLNMVQTVFSTLFDTIGVVMSGVMEFWGKVFDMLPEPVQDALSNILGNLKRFLDWVGGNISRVWGTVLELTAQAWHWVWDTIGKVLAGIANSIADFFEKIPLGMAQGWATSLRGFANQVGTGLGDAATSAVTSVIEKLKSFGGSVADAVSGLMQVASSKSAQNTNMLQGLFDKIRSSISGVIDKTNGLSTSFTKTGAAAHKTTPAIDRYTESASKAKDASSGAAKATESLKDPLAEAADLLSKITGAMDKALEMFAKLAKYDISKEQFARGWALLLDQIKIAVSGLADMLSSMGFQGEPGAEKMTALQSLAEMVTAVGDMVGALQAGLSSIVKFTAPAKANIDAILELMRYLVQQLVATAATYKKDGLEAAALLADTAGRIGDMIAATVEPLQAAASFKPVAMGAFGALADAIDRWVRGMVWLAAKYKEDGLKAARDMAETAAVIGDMLTAVMQPMADAARFRQVVQGGYAAIADAIERWVKGMVWLAGKFTDDGLLAARDMAATAAAIGESLAAVMEPFTKAATIKQVAAGAFGPLADAILRWVKGMAYLKTEIERAGLTTAGAAAMAATLSAVAESLITFMAVITQLVDYKSDGLAARVTGLLVDVQLVVNSLVTTFGVWSETLRETVIEAAASAEAALALLSPVSSMIAALQAIGAYERIEDIGRKITSVLEGVGDVGGLLLLTFQSWTEDFRTTVAAAATSAGLAAALMAPVSAMIDSLNAIAAYEHKANLAGNIRALIEDVGDVGGLLWLNFKGWSEDFQKSIVLAATAAAAAAALMSPVSAMVDALKAVAGYVAAKDLQAAVQSMLADAGIVFNALFAMFQDMDAKGIAIWQLAGQAATAYSSILSTVKGMVEGIIALATLPSLNPATVQANMSFLLTYAELFIAGVMAMASRLATDGVTAAGKLAEAGQQVFAMGKSGLDFLDALAELGTGYITPQKIDIVVDMMLYVLQSIAWLAYQIAPAMVTAAAAFSVYGKVVFDFFKVAVDALNDIATKAMPDEAKIDAFVAALQRVLSALTSAVGISGDINGALGDIGANLGMPQLALPDVVGAIARPTVGSIPWVSLPGRPSGGGGGGGGGGGASGEVVVSDFGEGARRVLATLVTAPVTATADDLMRQLEFEARMRGGSR